MIIDNDFIFLSRTRFVKTLNFFFRKTDLSVLTIHASTYWRTLAINFLTPAVQIAAIFTAIAAIFVDLDAFDQHMFLFKGLLVDSFGFLDHELPGLFEVFFVETIVASAFRTAIAQIFETGTMQSETI